MATDDLAGAIWLPGDGRANPTDLTQALASGRAARGARVVERRRVTGILVAGGARRPAWRTDARRRSRPRSWSTAPGQWAKQVGALAGVTVPLHSAEHFYVVTDQIEGVHPRPAGAARPGRVHLLQGGGRRPGRGRLRAGRQAMGRAGRDARIPSSSSCSGRTGIISRS